MPANGSSSGAATAGVETGGTVSSTCVGEEGGVDQLSRWVPIYEFAQRLMPFVVKLSTEKPQLKESVFWTCENLKVSTSYSGIGGPEQGLDYLQAAARDCEAAPNFGYTAVRAIEWNKDCRSVLTPRLCKTLHDAHLFGDLWHLLPTAVEKKVLEIEKTVAEPWDQWKTLILGCELLPRAPCFLHPCQTCPFDVADLEAAGSTCKDYSLRNRTRRGRQGPHAKYFLIWCKLVLTTRPKIVFHENNETFDQSLLAEVFSEQYHVQPMGVVKPSDIGHVSFSRPRRLHVLVCKSRCQIVGNVQDLYQVPVSAAAPAVSMCRDIW